MPRWASMASCWAVKQVFLVEQIGGNEIDPGQASAHQFGVHQGVVRKEEVGQEAAVVVIAQSVVGKRNGALEGQLGQSRFGLVGQEIRRATVPLHLRGIDAQDSDLDAARQHQGVPVHDLHHQGCLGRGGAFVPAGAQPQSAPGQEDQARN